MKQFAPLSLFKPSIFMRRLSYCLIGAWLVFAVYRVTGYEIFYTRYEFNGTLSAPYFNVNHEYLTCMRDKSGEEVYNGLFEPSEAKLDHIKETKPAVAAECMKVKEAAQKRQDAEEDIRYTEMRNHYLKSGLRKLFRDFFVVPAAIFVALNLMLWPIGIWLRDGIKQDAR